jgi:hypothetical protein
LNDIHTHRQTLTAADGQLVLRDSRPFREYSSSPGGEFDIDVWVAADVMNFYVNCNDIYTGKIRLI